MLWFSRKSFDEVFEDFTGNIGYQDYFKESIVLAATNFQVDKINREMVKNIPRENHTFAGADSVSDSDQTTIFPIEFLNSLSLCSISEHILKLKGYNGDSSTKHDHQGFRL